MLYNQGDLGVANSFSKKKHHKNYDNERLTEEMRCDFAIERLFECVFGVIYITRASIFISVEICSSGALLPL